MTTQNSKSLRAVNRELCSVNVSAPKGRSPINTLTRHRLNKPNLGEQVKEIKKLGVEMIEQETGKNQQKRVSAFEKVSNSHWTRKKKKDSNPQVGMKADYQNPERNKMSRVWWRIPVIPALWRLKHEGHELEGSLSYTMKTCSKGRGDSGIGFTIGGQPVEVKSLLPHGSWGLISGRQTWWQVSLSV